MSASATVNSSRADRPGCKGTAVRYGVPSLRNYLEIRLAAPVNFSPDGSQVLIALNLTGTLQLYRVLS